MDKTVHIIGFPMDLGSGRRGVDMGPSALRIAGLTEKIQLLGYSVIDEGDISVANQETCEIYSEKLKFLPAIKQANELLAQKVESVLENNGFPLIIGGDHAMGIGTIAGISSHCKKHGKTLGVLWIDAHADMNTPETTPSGNIHGMPLAVSMGYGAKELIDLHYPGQKIKPEHLVIIGARSIDPGERDFIREVGVTTHTMVSIDKNGMYDIVMRTLERMRSTVDHLHISFDLDSVDPSVAKGVGTPVPGGLSYREAHLLMEMAAESGLVSSFELSEVNPILDDMNASAVFATDIVASCMGKRIL
jgi:arginase